jgi:hypothetical protein
VIAAKTYWLGRHGILILAAVVAICALQLSLYQPDLVGELVARWAPLVIFSSAAFVCAMHAFGHGRGVQLLTRSAVSASRAYVVVSLAGPR